MNYKMISADDHLDLQYLPTNLWTERLPKVRRDRAPHPRVQLPEAAADFAIGDCKIAPA